MRLNLGCGYDVKEGYTNVDFRQIHPSVSQVDLSVFPWPFEDSSADEILMLDFLEHFPYSVTDLILLECYRILKPEGQVVIQVPDGEHLARALADVGDYLCNRCGGVMVGREFKSTEPCRECGQTVEQIAEAAMRRLYGGQDYPGNYHQTVFTKNSLKIKAAKSGLILYSDDEPWQQYPNWNFKMTFQKGDLWDAKIW